MIYLDNSATTRPFDGVIDVMDRCMREQYFNASAAYKPAVDVDRAMRECRKTIAAQLGIQESGVIFTSGGTESDNLAILGTAAALRQGANFVCSAIEHPAVRRPLEALRERGFEKPAAADNFLFLINEARGFASGKVFFRVSHRVVLPVR